MHTKCDVLVVRPAPKVFDLLIQQIISSVIGESDENSAITFSTPCYGGGYEGTEDQQAIQNMISGHKPNHVILIAYCNSTTAAQVMQLQINRARLREFRPANANSYQPKVHAFTFSLHDGTSIDESPETNLFVLTLNDDEPEEFVWMEVPEADEEVTA